MQDIVSCQIIVIMQSSWIPFDGAQKVVMLVGMPKF